MSRALKAGVRRLESLSPNTMSGLVVVPGGSPEGEAALLAEAERRGEVGRADLVEVLKRLASIVATRPEICPTRSVAGRVTPILEGFAEPAETPWVSDFGSMHPLGRA